MHIFHNTNYDFHRWRWPAIGLSWAVIVAGLISIAVQGIPLGVEFAGGTSVIVEFEQDTSIEAVRTALNSRFTGGNVIVQAYGEPGSREVMVRVPEVGQESGAELSTTADAAVEALRQGGVGAFTVVGTEIVGPAVGEELTSKGMSAMVLSLIGILAYIAFRFQFSFAVGAVVATLHDLLVVAAFLSFFQIDLTLNVIAAILTVAGYSTNDTIVIFDRVRENLRSMRRDALPTVVNTAINQTLGRTAITSGTTLMSALALYLFGGDVLSGFAFTLLVGVITGTFSSVFVAATVVTLWRDRGRSRAMAQAATATAPEPARRAKAARKARAS
ncbi:MAG: protein translocase subunit SecF [Vicinamibacterales bacterium]